MANTTYFVTGATGHLGSAILRHLLQLVPASRLIAGAHTPAKAHAFAEQGVTIRHIDFSDERLLEKAFKGTDILIYVPSKSHDSLSRTIELEHVVAAAEKADIKHVLAMGFIADQPTNPFTLSAFYGYLPRRLSSSRLHWTLVRDAMYADPLIPYLPELQERGNVIYPMGDQAISYISLDDCAAAFAKIAVTPSLLIDRKIWTLTANRAWTMPQLAEVLTRVGGKKIGYKPVTPEQFAHIYNQGGEGRMLASAYEGGAMGLLSEVCDDYQKIMGRPATGLEQVLREGLASQR
jgi:NAD(P)H dehydrogenase (quinone)